MNRILIALMALAATGVGENTEDRSEIKVALAAAMPEGEVRIGYSSPRRTAVERAIPRFIFEAPEFHAEDPLFFRIALGQTGGEPFYGALDRSPGATVHDLLYLDKDRDLDLTNDGPPIKANIRTVWTTESTLVEFLGIRLSLPYRVEGKEETEPYACVFFYVLGRGTKTPDGVLVERDGWREGAVELGGQRYAVVVVDDDSDGQFSTGDSWVLRPSGGDRGEMLSRDALRTMLFPSWSADQKLTVEVKSVDPGGRAVTIEVATAKETEREYFVRVARARQSDEERQLRIDPLRPKASQGQKIDWLEGKDAAWALDIARSAKVRKPTLLAFDAPNCRWCAMMDKYTFRDREVVQLADRYVCAKIAFKEGSDDVNRYKAGGTPTYVIVGLDGAEIARHAGFLRPAEFAAWLKSALR